MIVSDAAEFLLLGQQAFGWGGSKHWSEKLCCSLRGFALYLLLHRLRARFAVVQQCASRKINPVNCCPAIMLFE